MDGAAELRIQVSESAGEVSAILLQPPGATCLLVLAHGAGAGMRHAFMEATALRCAERGFATLRFQFPYMERGGGRPDPPARLTETIRAAIACARERAPNLPLFAGGKSLGGRMTSTLASVEPLPAVRGLIFLGFPLHSAGQPAESRADHLQRVDLPMLFMQGTRDSLAEIDPMRSVCRRLGQRATLHIVEGGDHSFHVLKRSGRTDGEALDEIADAVRDWCALQLTRR